MGLPITVLLADVIYVETLQSTVPVFDSLGLGVKKPELARYDLKRRLEITQNKVIHH